MQKNDVKQRHDSDTQPKWCEPPEKPLYFQYINNRWSKTLYHEDAIEFFELLRCPHVAADY